MSHVLTPWHDPPALLELKSWDVHLWRFPLVCSEPLKHLLDEQELQRSNRLVSPDKARAFEVARARLRQILAGYVNLAPQELTFAYGAAGKPELVGLAEPPAFNLAHSGHWGVCAVVGRGEVGVDVETINPSLDYARLARSFFSAAENQWLHNCPESRRRRCFFRIWTRKEAWLKGKGGGFTDPVQDLGSTHLAVGSTFDGVWWLRNVPVARGVVAALALSRQGSDVQCWNGWMD